MYLPECTVLRRQDYRTISLSAVKKNGDLIFKRVRHTLEIINNKKAINGFIGIYWPLAGEVDLRSLKNFKQFSLALPATQKSKTMTYHKWGDDPLRKDLNGIPSPISQPSLKPEQIDLLLIPALAIDKKGYRLGYGGGYFDRLKSNSKWRSIESIAVVPEECISSSSLPIDSWDIPLDGWISEKGFSKATKN